MHFGLWQFSACQNGKEKKKKSVLDPEKNIRLNREKNENKNKQKIK